MNRSEGIRLDGGNTGGHLKLPCFCWRCNVEATLIRDSGAVQDFQCPKCGVSVCIDENAHIELITTPTDEIDDASLYVSPTYSRRSTVTDSDDNTGGQPVTPDFDQLIVPSTPSVPTNTPVMADGDVPDAPQSMALAFADVANFLLNVPTPRRRAALLEKNSTIAYKVTSPSNYEFNLSPSKSKPKKAPQVILKAKTTDCAAGHSIEIRVTSDAPGSESKACCSKDVRNESSIATSFDRPFSSAARIEQKITSAKTETGDGNASTPLGIVTLKKSRQTSTPLTTAPLEADDSNKSLQNVSSIAPETSISNDSGKEIKSEIVMGPPAASKPIDIPALSTENSPLLAYSLPASSYKVTAKDSAQFSPGMFDSSVDSISLNPASTTLDISGPSAFEGFSMSLDETNRSLKDDPNKGFYCAEGSSEPPIDQSLQLEDTHSSEMGKSTKQD